MFDRILDLPALLRWIEISPRRIVDGEIQQREQRRDEWLQSLVAGQNRLRDLSADHLRLIGVLDPEVPSQEIADRQPGRRRSVGYAAAAEHAPALRRVETRELVREA